MYLPRTFINGGWLFSTVILVGGAMLTCYVGLQLIEISEKNRNLKSYSEIAYKSYGENGRILSDLSLIISQAGFCCTYLYFCLQNTQ
jgi:amino acid permease